MPTYEASGRSQKNGRKCKRLYEAWSLDEAHAKAEADGLLESSIQELPPTPPTERQLAYARDLGIAVPDGASIEEVSDLIGACVNSEKPSSVRDRAVAKSYGLYFTPYIGKESLFDDIQSVLSIPGRERDLVAWFTFRVLCGLGREETEKSIDGPNHPVIIEIATTLAADEAVLKSIRRHRGWQLIRFGEFADEEGCLCRGGSRRTIAYQECARAIREKIGIRSTSTQRGSSQRQCTAWDDFVRNRKTDQNNSTPDRNDFTPDRDDLVLDVIPASVAPSRPMLDTEQEWQPPICQPIPQRHEAPLASTERGGSLGQAIATFVRSLVARIDAIIWAIVGRENHLLHHFALVVAIIVAVGAIVGCAAWLLFSGE